MVAAGARRSRASRPISSPATASSRRSTASASRSGAARCWAWSANPAPARPSPASPSWAWSTRRGASSPARSGSPARSWSAARRKRCASYRGRKIAMIFQDPMMTLNPVLRIDTQMIEAITAHERVSQRRRAGAGARRRSPRSASPRPTSGCSAYPHQFSGGMRQRVAIAIALLHRPQLIIADEPTTALDVTIQAQILAEVQKLCAESGTALIWITHDLAVVSGLADRIAVMYAGRIVEEGPVDAVLGAPLHPYTRGLIGSVPTRQQRGAPLRQIPGMPPSPAAPAAGLRVRAALRARRCGVRRPRRPWSRYRAGPRRPLLAPLCREPRRPHDRADPRARRREQAVRQAARPRRARSPTCSAPACTRPSSTPSTTCGWRSPRRGGRPGRRIGLRQVHARAHGRRACCRRATGACWFRGVAIDELDGRSRRDAKLKRADDLPGPDGVAQSAHARRRHRRRGAGRARHRARRRRSATTSTRCWCGSASTRAIAAAIRTSSPAASGRASASRARWRCRPDFLVCDEAVAALDVSIQAQVLNLFIALRGELGLTYLFISHDLGVVEHHLRPGGDHVSRPRGRDRADRGALPPAEPPYTQALLANAPRVEAGRQRFTPIAGEIPSPLEPPSGCHFHPRCPFAIPRCRSERPMLTEIAPEHFSACHLNQGR